MAGSAPTPPPTPPRPGAPLVRARADQARDRSGQLPLDLRDTQLPWLDAQESDELRRGGSTRLLVIASGLLAMLALTGGAIWYVHRQHQAAGILATGEIIRAPQGPYKVRPANPGGDLAAGTGDTRFLVAEGKTRVVRVAGEAEAIADASGAAGVGVQIGAYGAGTDAEAAWPTLSARFPILSGLRHRVVEQQADMGSVFALQAVTADPQAGLALCRDLKAAGVNCMVRD